MLVHELAPDAQLTHEGLAAGPFVIKHWPVVPVASVVMMPVLEK